MSELLSSGAASGGASGGSTAGMSLSGGPGSGNPAGPSASSFFQAPVFAGGVQIAADILGGYQAKAAADNRAILYQQQSQLDLREAGAKVLEEENRARQVMGAGNAAAAGSGITQAGSPTLAARATAENANMTDVYYRYTGKLHSVEDLYQAKLQKYAGEQSLLSGYMKAGTDTAQAAAMIALA